MPITPYLNGERFDPESKRVLGVAFEMVCIALQTGDCADERQASDSEQGHRACESRRAQS